MRSNLSCAALAVLASAAMSTNISAHPDDLKPRRAGNDPDIAAAGGFSAVGIDLLANVTVPEFGAHGDGLVRSSDLFIMFGEWGPCPLPCPPNCLSDLDDDCHVGITDLFILFGNWG